MRIVLVLLITILPVEAFLYHIDQPVPNSLEHGEYCVEVRLWGEGGVLARCAVGLFARLTLGMSYSMNQLIGANAPILSRPRPEFLARVAILRELGYAPDLVLGFDSQGYDDYDYQVERFAVREKGVWLTGGKTIDLSQTYCQLGVNWWEGFDGSLVINQFLPGSAELILEYDLGLNDLPADKKWSGGWLNFGLAWTFQERMRLGFALRDVLGNKEETRRNRVFFISFRENF